MGDTLPKVIMKEKDQMLKLVAFGLTMLTQSFAQTLPERVNVKLTSEISTSMNKPGGQDHRPSGEPDRNFNHYYRPLEGVPP